MSEDDGGGVGMGEGGSARTVEAGASAQLRLQEAVVVGNQQGKVKFSELTMDMFRMVQVRASSHAMNSQFTASIGP